MDNQKTEVYTEDKISTMIKAYQEVQNTITRYDNNLNAVEHKISENLKNDYNKHDDKINSLHEELILLNKATEELLKVSVNIYNLLTSINERINRVVNTSKGISILVGILITLSQMGILHIAFGAKKP